MRFGNILKKVWRRLGVCGVIGASNEAWASGNGEHR